MSLLDLDVPPSHGDLAGRTARGPHGERREDFQQSYESM